MKTYVLIHGAWHRSWCWQKIIPIIQSNGHRAIAPDIDWYNNDTIPAAPGCIPTYVNTLCNLIRKLEKNIILVGHSMGGVVISQIAETIPEHLHSLVYVSGFLLANGQCVNDTKNLMSDSLIQPHLKISRDKKNISLPTSKLREGFYLDCSLEDYNFALTNICPQPITSFTSPIQISDDRFGKISRTYIECLQDMAIPLSAQRMMHNAMKCNIVHSLNSSHAPFFSQTKELSKLLLML
ncbi:MAG: carboxypeptidase C (cathepsin A) [Gammaproteobacteria bacterium]|jgi:carboxypeptidase C (cathepsin A)